MAKSFNIISKANTLIVPIILINIHNLSLMKTSRIITLATVIIGLCVGVMIKAYFDNPEDFAFMDHFGLLCLILGMGLFIFGHLRSKKSVG